MVMSQESRKKILLRAIRHSKKRLAELAKRPLAFIVADELEELEADLDRMLINADELTSQ